MKAWCAVRDLRCGGGAGGGELRGEAGLARRVPAHHARPLVRRRSRGKSCTPSYLIPSCLPVAASLAASVAGGEACAIAGGVPGGIAGAAAGAMAGAACRAAGVRGVAG